MKPAKENKPNYTNPMLEDLYKEDFDSLEADMENSEHLNHGNLIQKRS